MTDTERLNFLLRYLVVDDIGDEDVVPGVCVDSEGIEEALFPGMEGEEYYLLDGWQNPDMRRVIDKAIAAVEVVR